MKLRAMMRTVCLLDSWNSSHIELSDEDLAQKANRAQGILLVVSCLFLASILYGCGDRFKSTAEINREFNRRAAGDSYNNAHDNCWQLFSRVDPERNREYRECMSKKGWRA